MGIFIARLATETGTFVPFPAGMAGLEDYGISPSGSAGEEPPSGAMQRDLAAMSCTMRDGDWLPRVDAPWEPHGGPAVPAVRPTSGQPA